MNYPYRAYVVVSDAEVSAARALVASELGPIEGGGWFSVELVDAEGGTFWASSSALTEANVATIVWFQNSPNALDANYYVFLDVASGNVVDKSAGIDVEVGAPCSFAALVASMGLTVVTREDV